MVELRYLHPYDIGVHHEKIHSCITDALEFTDAEMTLDDVLNDLKSGELGGFGLFVDTVLIGFITAKVVVYPRKRYFRVVTMGGITMSIWKQVDALVVHEASKHNCDGIEFWCRPGAAKIAREQFGYTQQYTILVRNLP